MNVVFFLLEGEVIHQRLNFIFRRFGILCLFFLHRLCLRIVHLVDKLRDPIWPAHRITLHEQSPLRLPAAGLRSCCALPISVLIAPFEQDGRLQLLPHTTHALCSWNEDRHNFYVSPNIKMIRSRIIRWAGHVARMGKRYAGNLVVVNPERKRQLGRQRPGWKDNIKNGV